MSRFKAVPRIVLSVLLLGIVVSVGVVLAQGDRPANAEGDQQRPIDSSISVNDAEVIVVETDIPFDNFVANGEGQPDTTVFASSSQEIETQMQSRAPQAQYFKRAAGSNFVPRDSTVAFSYGGGGCLQRNSNTGDSWFTLDLQLPDGAEIDFLRVFYYDADATYNINSELWAFDGAGGTTLIAEADSSGSPGYSSAGSDFFSHIVNNTNQSLVIVASIQGGVGASLKLCGVRVRYQYNLSGSYLPAILNQATP